MRQGGALYDGHVFLKLDADHAARRGGGRQRKAAKRGAGGAKSAGGLVKSDRGWVRGGMPLSHGAQLGHPLEKFKPPRAKGL